MVYRNLPGKKIPNSDLHRLECGCVYKYWKITGIDYISVCEKHERARKEAWKTLSFSKRLFSYAKLTFFLIFIALVVYGCVSGFIQ